MVQQANKNNSEATKIVKEKLPDGIIFINLKLKKMGNKDTCIFINLIKASGDFKDNIGISADYHSSIICELYSCTNKLLETVILENPLNRRVDLFSEKGEIESKELALEEAEFGLRVHSKNEVYCYLKIHSKEKNKTTLINKVTIN